MTEPQEPFVAEGKPRSTTMLEKAARAMWEAQERWLGSNMPWEEANETGGKEPCRLLARAVLTAIREPSPAMLGAWDDVGIDQGPRDYWPAGIDAILSETPK